MKIIKLSDGSTFQELCCALRETYQNLSINNISNKPVKIKDLLSKIESDYGMSFRNVYFYLNKNKVGLRNLLNLTEQQFHEKFSVEEFQSKLGKIKLKKSEPYQVPLENNFFFNVKKFSRKSMQSGLFTVQSSFDKEHDINITDKPLDSDDILFFHETNVKISNPGITFFPPNRISSVDISDLAREPCFSAISNLFLLDPSC